MARTERNAEACRTGVRRHPLVLNRLLGEAWTKEQEQEFQDAVRNLGRIRIEFAKTTRKELREADVDILAGIPDVAEAEVS